MNPVYIHIYLTWKISKEKTFYLKRKRNCLTYLFGKIYGMVLWNYYQNMIFKCLKYLAKVSYVEKVINFLNLIDYLC